MKVLVLASGQGSNFEALLRYARSYQTAYQIIGLVCDQPEAGALSIAKAHRVPVTLCVKDKDETKASYNQRLTRAIQDFAPELVVLAGFMRILGPDTVDAFKQRIINIHPSLLPAYPGLNAPEQALRGGASLTGCTVHIVDAQIDHGPVLAQSAVAIQPSDTPQLLHARIQTAEHQLFPSIVEKIARGEIKLDR